MRLLGKQVPASPPLRGSPPSSPRQPRAPYGPQLTEDTEAQKGATTTCLGAPSTHTRPPFLSLPPQAHLR